MTKKEKLFVKVNELINKYNEMIVGHENYHEMTPYPVRPWQWKVYELENAISNVEQRIKSFINAREVESFYETEEGRLRKESIESQLNLAEKTYSEIHDTYLANIREMILKSISVGEWSVNGSENSVHVGIVDPENKTYQLFGHSFDISYTEWGNKELTINYGTMGAFDPIKNPYRAIFLAGLAEVANNNDLLIELKKVFETYRNKVWETRKEIDRLSKELANPLNAA